MCRFYGVIELKYPITPHTLLFPLPWRNLTCASFVLK
jgi:hypothetical protein